MPKLNKIDAPESMHLEGYEGHFGELGDYTVGFETYTADADLAELFRGLPERQLGRAWRPSDALPRARY